MVRYVVLLRGINVSGKNKVPMPGLKKCLEEAGFSSVRTYLNSGNILLSSPKEEGLAEEIQSLVLRSFGIAVPVLVRKREEVEALLSSAPIWWGREDKTFYDNLIFLFPGVSAEEIVSRIGAPTEGLEQIACAQGAIFWTFDRAKYQKCRWWKRTAEKGIGEVLTIRTANTIRGLLAME